MNRELELAIDQHILERSSNSLQRIEAVISECAAPPCHMADLMAAFEGAVPMRTELSPVVLGAYLASRMMLVGFQLGRDLPGSLYALADSVRGVDAVSILRWLFILKKDSGHECSNAMAQAIRQTGHVLEGLSSISADPELEWERCILRIL